MTTGDSKVDIYVSVIWLENENSFKYLGTTLPKDCSSTDILIRIETILQVVIFVIFYHSETIFYKS